MELNKVVCMDNLEYLKLIPNNYINLIYSDILYNTGKKFKDFNDRLGTPTEAMEWYKPRLVQMKRTLKNTGSIYLQCDYRLIHYLKIEMDKIFGIKNFRNEIIWCYRQGGGSKDCFSKKHDTILWYSKSNKWTFNADEVRIPYNGTGGYVNNSNGSVVNGKKYKPNELGKISEDWWDIPAINPVSSERIGYDTQKPLLLMDRIVKASSNKGDLCADFFMGSASFLVKAKELNRNYIGCDIGEKAVEIANNRLARFNNFNVKL